MKAGSRLLEMIARGICARPALVFSLCLLLTLVSLFSSRHLAFKPSLNDLLPRGYESVKNLEEMTQRIGGIGFLIAALEGENLEASKRFARDLGARLLRELPQEIKYVDCSMNRDFFVERRLLYISLEDLREIKRRIQRKITDTRLRANPFLLDLTEEKERPVSLDFSDIEKKYRRLTPGGDYYVSKDKKLLVVLIKPLEASADIAFSRRLVENVERNIREMNPKGYDPGLRVTLTGRYKNKVVEQDFLERDIKKTGGIALTLIALLLWASFRSKRAVLLMVIPLLMSLQWTWAITYLTVGSLNVITGFFTAILLGIGIDYEIMFYSRYLEEKARGLSCCDALAEAQGKMGRAFFSCAFATALSFFALLFSHFRGFSEFGLVAGVGILMNLLATLTALPSLMMLAERFSPLPFVSPRILKEPAQPLRHPRIVLGVGVVLMLAGLSVIPRVHFEYSFLKLGVKSTEPVALRDRINKVFGFSLTPTPVLAESLEEAAEIKQAVQTAIDSRPQETALDRALSIFFYFPRNQKEKLQVMQEIRGILERHKIEIPKKWADLRKWLRVKEVRVETIPSEAIRQFEDVQGRRGLFVYIFPKVDMADGQGVMRFAEEIRHIRLADGRPLRASGEELIFADILTLILKEGMRDILMTLAAIIILLFLDFRSPKWVLCVLTPLFVGVSWMLGLMFLLGISLNFLNVIIFARVIGMCVTQGIYLMHRALEKGAGQMKTVVRTLFVPLGLSVTTTLIGFGTLLLTSHRGLNSIGAMAVVGDFSCFLASMMILPALIQIVGRKS